MSVLPSFDLLECYSSRNFLDSWMSGYGNFIWICDYAHVGHASMILQGIFLDPAQQGPLEGPEERKRRGTPGRLGMSERDKGLAREDSSLLWKKMPRRDPLGLEEW